MGAAEKWVTMLEDRVYFTVDMLAGGANIQRGEALEELTMLATREYPLVSEHVDGLYCREPAPYGEDYLRVAFCAHRAARTLLPAGSGLSDYSALSAASWIHQGVVVPSFAVPKSAPASLPEFPHRQPKLVVRSNPHRLELTWHEITLLEAIMFFPLHDPRLPFKAIVSELIHELPIRAGGPLLVRRSAVRDAAEHESVADGPPPFHDLWGDLEGRDGFLRTVKRITRGLPRRWEEDIPPYNHKAPWQKR